MIGPRSYKYCAILTFLFSLSKHLLLCPDMVWLSTFYLVCTNYGRTIQCSPNCCCCLPLRRPRRLWVERSQWYLLLFIRCCLRGLGSCFKYLPWIVRCKSSHRVILWYCWPLVGGVVGLLGVPPPSVFPPHSQNHLISPISQAGGSPGGRMSPNPRMLGGSLPTPPPLRPPNAGMKGYKHRKNWKCCQGHSLTVSL